MFISPGIQRIVGFAKQRDLIEISSSLAPKRRPCTDRNACQEQSHKTSGRRLSSANGWMTERCHCHRNDNNCNRATVRNRCPLGKIIVQPDYRLPLDQLVQRGDRVASVSRFDQIRRDRVGENKPNDCCECERRAPPKPPPGHARQAPKSCGSIDFQCSRDFKNGYRNSNPIFCKTAGTMCVDIAAFFTRTGWIGLFAPKND